MIADTMAISSFPSSIKRCEPSRGPIFRRPQTRIRVHDSRHSFSPMQHFEMKSASLSAARASSSIVANERLQLSNCGTIRRPTPPCAISTSQKPTTEHA